VTLDFDRARPARRVLCVAPAHTHSFGTFDHALPLVGARAFMPPQGILTIAAYLPPEWDVRFHDENVAPLGDDDLRWADVVMTTGMHVQRPRILDLIRRARAAGALTVLGGPSVSAAPDWYPEPDILHVGELGDATEALIERIDRSLERPAEQQVYRTEDRLPLHEFPLPAYHFINLRHYLLGSVQWSSGCPYRCEFCDIPTLYGRRPRLKDPERVTAELDAMLSRGNPGAVYFVDDNFVGNPKAARELLETLVDWQEERGFPVAFCCEATVNAAKRPELLELMRRANFQTIFCGIESPDVEALRGMGKTQNATVPVLEAVQTFNSYGLEVVSGIIVGLDTDTPESYSSILRFIEASQIPLLTINVLYALPRTPLWDRLAEAGRISDEAGRVSNVKFLLPYDTVLSGWRRLVREAYRPEKVYARFRHQMRHTYPNRRTLAAGRPSLAQLRQGLPVLGRLLWHVGVRADYRREFWRALRTAWGTRDIEGLVSAAIVSHHLICFAREALEEGGEASFYSPDAASAEAPRSAVAV
jgi:radical SAM superfamily enzyme YgiQ (UPF0313 family)